MFMILKKIENSLSPRSEKYFDVCYSDDIQEAFNAHQAGRRVWELDERFEVKCFELNFDYQLEGDDEEAMERCDKELEEKYLGCKCQKKMI
jgi:hypothetical protein